jgi:phospholipid/cholesterol/gamma-HCH transport system substrate-binding protein
MASLQASAANAEIITNQLSQIMMDVNSGEGALGRLIQDPAIADNITQTIENFKKSSEGFDETIEVTKQHVFEFMEKLQLTAAKTEIASQELGEIMTKINSGEGSLGVLIHDTTMAGNLNQTIINLKQSTQGLDENMQALKHNFFFRRYYRRMERAELRRIEEESMLEEQIEGNQQTEEQQ